MYHIRWYYNKMVSVYERAQGSCCSKLKLKWSIIATEADEVYLIIGVLLSTMSLFIAAVSSCCFIKSWSTKIKVKNWKLKHCALRFLSGIFFILVKFCRWNNQLSVVAPYWCCMLSPCSTTDTKLDGLWISVCQQDVVCDHFIVKPCVADLPSKPGLPCLVLDPLKLQRHIAYIIVSHFLSGNVCSFAVFGLCEWKSI